MSELPTLYVCHGDEGGPRIHPCRRVQEALAEQGIEYEKVIAGHGNPLPFLRKGSREALEAETGYKATSWQEAHEDPRGHRPRALPGDPSLGARWPLSGNRYLPH